VQAGDIIRIPPVQLEPKKLIQNLNQVNLSYLEDMILYEDPDFLIINKPTGLAVHGGTGIDSGLIERLRILRPTAKKLELVHRLDRDTSGCIIIAKKYSVLTYFHAQFKEHKIKKLYHALVVGNWPKAVHKIDQPLKKNVASSGERFTHIASDGKESLTTVRIIEKYNSTTLLEARLHTGRTHQIRVHLKYVGCPIVGDSKYGQKDMNLTFHQAGVKRLLLHANQLTFTHPKSGEKVSVLAKYDEQFKNALQFVKK
jgi:23S rRNA pseudouridine955/2504/2580 synthase